MFSIKDGSFKRFENGTVKLLAEEEEGIKARADSREQGERGKVEEEKELDGGPRMICTSQLVGSRVLGLTSMITRRLGDGEGKGKGEYS